MKRFVIWFFCSLFIWNNCSSNAAHADAVSAYLFGRQLGMGIAEVVKSGTAYFRSKQQGSVAIEKARQAFWNSYPNKSSRAQAEKHFQELLTQKDLAYLAIYMPVGLSKRSNLLAKLGGHLDNGIPRSARMAYFSWVYAVREFLGARRHYTGNNGERPDLVVASPARILEALLTPDIIEIYHKYKLARDRAEFAAVNKTADFDRLLKALQIKKNPEAEKPRADITTVLVKDTHKLKIPQKHKLMQFGRTVIARAGKVYVGGKEGALFIFNPATSKLSGRIGPVKPADQRFSSLASDISGRYMIVGDSFAMRDDVVLRSIVGGQRLVRARRSAGAAYIYDLKTGKKARTLVPELPPKTNFRGLKINQSIRPRFGAAVAISGPYAIVGAPGEEHGRGSGRWTIDGYGAAYIFDIRTGRQIKRLTGWGKKQFGYSVAINKKYAAVGAPGSPLRKAWKPEVHLYNVRDGAALKSFMRPTPKKGSGFGLSLAFSDDKLLIGAPLKDKSVYVIELADRKLAFQIKASDYTTGRGSGFGLGLAVKGDTACIGAYYEGAVYCLNLKSRKVAIAIRSDILKGQPNKTVRAFFGYNVAFDKGYVVIGAHGEDQLEGNVYVIKPRQNVVNLDGNNERQPAYTFIDPITKVTSVEKPANDLPKFLGTWHGRYICAQGPTGVTITFAGQDLNKVTARFKFYPLAENPGVPPGEFIMEGRIFRTKSKLLAFDLKPKRWVKRPAGFEAVGMNGTLLNNDKHLRARLKYLGCRMFMATRNPIPTNKLANRKFDSRQRSASRPANRSDAGPIRSCKRRAADYRDKSRPITCRCARDSMGRYSVYGTGIYTSDSNVCRAALHAGKVNSNGGLVTFHFQKGQSKYTGSTSNGVTTKSWDRAWHSSFVFE